MIKYSEQEIINKVNFALSNKKTEELYKEGFLNYKGKTKDTEEYYTEVISRELIINNFVKQLNEIQHISRLNYSAGHTGVVTTSNTTSNRIEDRIAIALFNASKNFGITFGELGEIIDYQIPLKKTQKDYGVGEIDLISKSKNSIWLIELKYYKHKDKEANKETLLKAALEIATYYQWLDKDSFLKSYDDFKGYTQEQIKKAVLIFNENERDEEYLELMKGEMPFLKNLLKRLDVSVFDLGVGKI
ncbi:hypothetical protein SAMN02745221_02137 [Thermosyntropha lipolytica DSM 11003]|uniref:Uncharacterized protein n=1 Tax=Thermosyntropha lipolytica DSM 11003 TaxID=1123382 RepID=A0A1M5RZ89_9FIRM|nr:hypothetical protein [Thermosyntropha lipolytica]SHH31491.1 hypothetical protein SAMN02745221_02137 [Thermosyntropha lipolytica DSM 11003]